MLMLSVACHSNKQTPGQRAQAARALFEQTTKSYHIPSAEAKGDEKLKLQEQAVAGYTELLKTYPDQDYWAAEALRSLGNIRAAQTNLNEAVRQYAAVERKYPRQDWEILMAWKSAADVLWEAGRRDEAKVFYQKIVKRFDGAGATQVTKTVVRGSKSRLADADTSPAR
jgi:tetratricopeptide (TPR) repeat protein